MVNRCPQNKPWLKSTGPRTEAGKAASAQRWRKHGLKSADHKLLQVWLRSLRALVARQAHAATPNSGTNDK